MNKALTSKYTVEDHFYPLNLAWYKVLQLALVDDGYDADRYAILEPLCNSDLKVLEARKNNWVVFYVAALNAGVDMDTVPDMGSCDDPTNIITNMALAIR